jgi:hypothetical protein
MNLFKDLLYSVLWPASFEGLPAGGESLGLGDDRIRNVVKATRERLEHEHVKDMVTGTPAQDGWHRQGSAKCYFQTDPPETRPDGVTALTVEDNGRVWVHSTNYREYVYHHAAGATPATRWVVRTAILGGNNIFSGDSSFLGSLEVANLSRLERSFFNMYGEQVLMATSETRGAGYSKILQALGFSSDPTESFYIPCNGYVASSGITTFYSLSFLFYSHEVHKVSVYYHSASTLSSVVLTKGSVDVIGLIVTLVLPRYIERRVDDSGV